MMKRFCKMTMAVLISTSMIMACPAQSVYAANDTTSAVSDSTSVSADELCEYAQSDDFIGLPYVTNGYSMKGFDCSGFTKYVYAHFGIELDHYTKSQVKMGTKVDSIDDLQKGDLVFFNSNSHVGIYVGDGYFVHSSYSGLEKTYLFGRDSQHGNYWHDAYCGARRILEEDA